MKKSATKALSVEQLQEQIAGEKDRLQKMKFAHAITPVENPLRIREARREVARLLTQLNSQNQ